MNESFDLCCLQDMHLYCFEHHTDETADGAKGSRKGAGAGAAPAAAGAGGGAAGRKRKRSSAASATATAAEDEAVGSAHQLYFYQKRRMFLPLT